MSLDIIEELKTSLHSVDSLDPGARSDDLLWLKPLLRDARVVGLGEATHGTSEFFRMKHRLIEFLIVEMGYRAIAFEASYAGCLNINRYVLYGEGSAEAALASQGFWTWDTAEVLALIEWLRAYNKSVPETERVKFIGIDFQSNHKDGAFTFLKDYLRKVDPESEAHWATVFERISEFDQDRTHTNFHKKDIWDFLSMFAMKRGHYLSQSSQSEYDQAYCYLVPIAQLVDSFLMAADDPRRSERDWRDYYMANNLLSFMNDESTDTKVVVWAHNAHVSKEVQTGEQATFKPLGSYLQDAFGTGYFSVGFAFSKGAFQAIASVDDKPSALKEFQVSDAEVGTFDWHCAQTKEGRFILPTRHISQGPLKSYIEAPLSMRSYGAWVEPRFLASYSRRYPLSDAFDAIVFIDDTHRANPTATGVR